jgi:hypothetical protein
MAAPRRLPECRVAKISYIVDNIVTTTGRAGELIGCRKREHVRGFVMGRRFLVRTRSGVAMQAFAIVVGRVEFDFPGLWYFSQILYQDMVHAPPLRFVIPEHRVIGVAGEAGMIARDEAILKMRARKKALVVHVQAPAKISHDMAGQAEFCGSRSLDLFVKAGPNGERRKDAERHKGKYFAAAQRREFRSQSGLQTERGYRGHEENEYERRAVHGKK